MSDVFCDLVGCIEDFNFGVNYDLSNIIFVGEDFIELLEKVKERVVIMYVLDWYLVYGIIEDLRKVENSKGYVVLFWYGEIGKGLNDYD